MNPFPASVLRATAEEAARRGGAVLKELFEGPRTLALKGGIDLVTDADQAAEAEILAFLRHRFPEASILAEESGATDGQADLRWMVDPLDGTTNYAHRVPHFCVSVAAEGPHGVLAGAVYQPLTNELFSTGKGQGATLNGSPVAVSRSTELVEALLCTGFPYDVRERPSWPVGLFNHFIRKGQGIRRTGSAALDLAYVAAGRFDGFFEFGLKPWDIAAGALLVEEAGGVVSDLLGSPLRWSSSHILASGRALLPALRSELQEFFQEHGFPNP